ncbi:MAG TPA: hypothetical protein VK735_41755 [Pseudonocardia sp.]|uniref:hypothetical protein n=1 Tax=Pseudonocardia sp. TaxID=60912 RepID=UPI002BE1C63A|nr:hypothetical protein [Pseudonocardia sp.]HTF54013.1 hypothetical protein [Pseudonocardia sp.]
MVAEFESDLIKMRTREGMKVARAKGRLRGQDAQAQPLPGSPPRRATPGRRAHQRRTRRAVLRGPVHRSTARSNAHEPLRQPSPEDPSLTLRFGSASGVPGLGSR